MDVKTTLKKQESQSDIDLICQHNVELMWLSHRLAMPNYKEEEGLFNKMIKVIDLEIEIEKVRKENAHLKKEVRRLLAMSTRDRRARGHRWDG